MAQIEDASSLSERKTAERTVEDCRRFLRLDMILHRSIAARLSPLLVRGIVKVMCQAYPAMNPRPTLPAFHPLRLAIFWQ